jgi:hypothetical protein
MAPKLPQAVIAMMAERSHRMHHYLWHEVRNGWLSFSPEDRKRIAALGWEPPRPARRARPDGSSEPILDNNSGEDFLYMHRDMIASVNAKLAQVRDEAYPKVQGWQSPPPPTDKDWPVPPAYSLGDPGSDQYIQQCKSNDFYSGQLTDWVKSYTDAKTLKSMSLGELGSRLEFTIHNQMHMRWSSKPAGVRPDADPATPEVIAKNWDRSTYNWLGDTYSSHVNPVFWKLHGWVDSCIDRWMQANGKSGSVSWKGTWIGPAQQSMPRMLMPGQDVGTHGHHDHIDNMLEVARVLRGTGVTCHFYDRVAVPPLPEAVEATGSRAVGR